MKSTWFGDHRRYEFAKTLRDADYRCWGSELFRTFLEMAYYSMRQAVHVATTGKQCADIESKYMASVKKVKHPNKMAEAMAQLALALEEKPYDFLGSVFQELGANDKTFAGQCFTPSCLARLMAEMTVHDTPEPGSDVVWFDEPAAGGGCMVIETTNVMREKCWSNHQFHWHAADVDWRCFAMTYIQTTLLDIPCVVQHQNTLTLATYETARNLSSYMHHPFLRRGAGQQPRVVEPAAVAAKPAARPLSPLIAESQLMLFDAA